MRKRTVAVLVQDTSSLGWFVTENHGCDFRLKTTTGFPRASFHAKQRTANVTTPHLSFVPVREK